MAKPLDMVNKVREQRLFKVLFLYALGVCMSFVFWFSIKTNFDTVFLTTEGANNLIYTGIALLFFCLFLAAFANGVYFLRKIGLIVGLILLLNLPYIFVFGLTIFALEGFLFLTIGLYYWSTRIKAHMKKNPLADPYYVGRFGLKVAITIFLFVIAFSFYINIAFEGQVSYFIPRLEQYVVRLTHQSAKFVLPGYEKEMSVDHFLTLAANNKFWKRFLVSDANVDFSNPQTISLMRQGLEQQFKMSFRGKSVEVLINTLVDDYVTNNLLKFQKIFSGAAAIAFFLFLKIFSIIYYLITRAFIWLWLKIFFLLKVVQKTKETIEIEKMAL